MTAIQLTETAVTQMLRGKKRHPLDLMAEIDEVYERGGKPLVMEARLEEMLEHMECQLVGLDEADPCDTRECCTTEIGWWS